MFSYKFCEISKNIFFTEQFWTTASVSDSTSNTRPHFTGDEKLKDKECVVPDRENTEYGIRLLSSPNDECIT